MNNDETISLVNSPEPVRQQRPDWRAADAYIGSAQWTGRRWAWEFLRRNPEYQAVSEKSVPTLAARFGVVRMKSYQEEYTPEMEHGGFWSVEHVGVIRPGLNRSTKTLEDSELALVFDLDHINKMGQGAIHVMLAACKRTLEKELLRVTIGGPARGPMIRERFVRPGRPGVKGVRHFRLLHLLRLLDATQKKASDEEIITLLYLQYRNVLTCGLGASHESAMARDKVSEDKKTATLLMESGYLELIPRDYIQDRRIKRE